MKNDDLKELLKNNPQITGIQVTCFPNDDACFWRGFKYGLGGCTSVLFCVLITLFLMRVM